MSVDLSTTYLGLKLKNPLVISACPLSGGDRPVAASGAGRRRRGRLALAVRGADRARRRGNDQGPRVRHRELRRIADLLPRAGRLPHRAGRISRNHRRGEEGGGDSGHRQPQRRQPRRLAPLREDDARRRGRRPGTEHLLRGRRPRHDQPRRGIPLPRPRGRREAVDLDSRWRSRSGRISAPWATWACGWPRPAPTAWCCSTASSSPTSTWRRMEAQPQAPLEHARRVAGAAAVDRHPARPRQGLAGRHRRHPRRRRTC